MGKINNCAGKSVGDAIGGDILGTTDFSFLLVQGEK